jgi:hypothetical protein
LAAVSVAEFVWTAQLATVVALVTWIATFAPGARLTGEHVNDCGAPEIEQPAGPEAIDQLSPAPDGNASVIATPSAVPVPSALPLEAVIVNPMVPPADTLGASAVLVSESDGHSTVVDASATIEPALVADNSAMFE